MNLGGDCVWERRVGWVEESEGGNMETTVIKQKIIVIKLKNKL